MITNQEARTLLDGWHSGMWSPFYAAMSSGLVADFEVLLADAARISEEDQQLLLPWLRNQVDKAETVVVAGAEYKALPWAEEKPYWFSTSSGRIEFQLTLKQANDGFHPGQCDADIQALSQRPEVRKTLEALEPTLLQEELKEYGAWDVDELQDHEANLQRLLWLACGDIRERHWEDETE